MALYKSLVKKVSIPADRKTKQKEYEIEGQLAIVDQGKKMIGGYTNNWDMLLECTLIITLIFQFRKIVLSEKVPKLFALSVKYKAENLVLAQVACLWLRSLEKP